MNTKKMVAIFMCMLVVALIPVAAGATTKQTQDPETSDIGVTYLRGIITKPQLVNGGNYISFRCIWVHYNTRGIGESQSGFLHLFQKLVVDIDKIGYIGNHFVLARFQGQLDI
jgi:hypothetical protein